MSAHPLPTPAAAPSRARRRPFSLRQLITALVCLLLLGLGASLALGAADRTMTRAVLDVQQDAAAIPAADELSVGLLSFSRLGNLELSGGHPELEPLRVDSRARTLRRLDDLRRFVDGPGQEQAYEQMRQKVQAYFVQYDRAWRSPGAGASASASKILAVNAPTLDEALHAVNIFRAYNVAQIQGETATAQRWTQLARAGRITVVGVLGSTCLLLMVGLLWGLERPVRRLTGAIASYSEGNLQRRAEAGGPEELRRIGQAFNLMAERLEEARVNRLQFLSAVAHDLLNPLSALRVATHPRHLERLHKSPEAMARAWSLVGRQVLRLERLVGDLLDTSRIESGHFELDTRVVDLRELARETAALFCDQSVLHRVEAKVPDEPVLSSCDPLRIEQVLNNLVNNAIKYSPGGGMVRLWVEEVAGMATLAVSDQGVGIPPAERELVFEPFRRGALGGTTAPGVGLGLSVARRIVLAHGGRLEVDSLPGVGSTFRVLLPVAPARQKARRDGQPVLPV